MLAFTAVNTATDEKRVILALNIGDAYRTTAKYVFTKKTDKIRVYPHCAKYLAVQIAKTVSRKTLQYMETPTQRRIMDSLDRGTAKFNHSLRGTSGEESCTLFFNSLSQYETDSHGMITRPAVFNQDTDDFVSIALVGILCSDGDIIEKAESGFRELNRYIESLRTRNEKEVLTAYDIETDTPVNTEIRRIVKGLTVREEEEDKEIKDSALAIAIHAVSKTLTPTQRDLYYRLAKGHSIYRVSKDTHRDKKTVKENRGYIQIKALRNDVIMQYLTDNHSPLCSDIEKPTMTNEQWTVKNDYLCHKTQGGQWAGKNSYAYITPAVSGKKSYILPADMASAPNTTDHRNTAPATATANIITVWTKDGQPKTLTVRATMKPLPQQDSRKALLKIIKGIMDSHRGTEQYKRMTGHSPRYIDRVINMNQAGLYR